MAEPFVKFLSSKTRNNFLINVTFHILAPAMSLLELVRRTICTVIGVQRFRPEHSLPFIQAFLLLCFHPTWTAVTRLLIMQGVAAYMTVSLSFAVHRTEYHWTAGDPVPRKGVTGCIRTRAHTPLIQCGVCSPPLFLFFCFADYASHIVATTTDHSVHRPDWFSLIIFAFLNSHHVLHHIFPTVDHSQLHRLRPLFEDTLKEFGVPYHAFDFKTLFYSMLRRHDFVYAPAA